MASRKKQRKSTLSALAKLSFLFGSAGVFLISEANVETNLEKDAYASEDLFSGKNPVFVVSQNPQISQHTTRLDWQTNREPKVSLMSYKRDNRIKANFQIANLVRFANQVVKLELLKTDRTEEGVMAAYNNDVSNPDTQRIVKIDHEPIFTNLYRYKEAKVNSNGEVNFAFDLLAPSTELVARLVFPDGEEAASNYVLFDTNNPNEFVVENLRSSASTVSFKLKEETLATYFSDTDTTFDLAIGYRYFNVEGKQKPWILKSFSINSEKTRVLLDSLDPGKDYELAIFGVRDTHKTMLSTPIRVKTKTINEVKSRPYLRAYNQKSGQLDLEVNNIYWRGELVKELRREDLVTLPLFNQSDPIALEDYKDGRTFELRAFYYLSDLPPERRNVTYKQLGLQEEVTSGFLSLVDKEKQPPNLIVMRQTTQPGSGKLNFSLNNLPQNATLVFRVFEVFRENNYSQKELYLPISSKEHPSFKNAFDETFDKSFDEVVVNTRDLAFAATTRPKIARDFEVLTENSLKVIYRHFPGSERGFFLRYRRVDQQEFSEASSYHIPNGLVAHLENLKPNSQYLLELLDGEEVIDVSYFTTLDTFQRDLSQEKITDSQASLYFKGYQQYLGMLFRVELENEAGENVYNQHLEVTPDFRLDFSQLLPSTQYRLKVFNDDSSQNQLLLESNFVTQRAYALQFAYEGKDILFFAPYEENLFNKTDEPQYLATPLSFEYREQGTDGAYFIQHIPQPNPLNDYLPSGEWVKLDYFKPNQSYEYKYSFIKEGKKQVVSQGVFSTLVNFEPNVWMEPLPYVEDEPNKSAFFLKVSPRSNSLYRVTYSPILDKEFYQAKEIQQTLYSRKEFTQTLTLEAPIRLERSFVFDWKEGKNNQDGTVTFVKNLVLGRDLMPGFEYRFRVEAIPEVVPNLVEARLGEALEFRHALSSIDDSKTSPLDSNFYFGMAHTILKNQRFLIYDPGKPAVFVPDEEKDEEESQTFEASLFVNPVTEGKNAFGLLNFEDAFLFAHQNKELYIHLLAFLPNSEDIGQTAQLPVEEYFVKITPESIFKSKLSGYNLAAFLLKPLNPKYSYIIKLVALKEAPKHPQRLLDKLNFTKPLLQDFVGTQTLSSVYTTTGEDLDKVVEPDLEKALPNFVLADKAKPLRVSRHVVEMDLQIPSLFSQVDRQLEIRVFEHNNLPIPLDEDGVKKVAQLKRRANFYNAPVVKTLNTKEFGKKRNYTLRLSNLKANTHYSLAIFDIAQPSLPVFVTHDIQTQNPEVRQNYTSAVVTFSDITDQRFFASADRRKEVNFVLSTNPNFAPSSEESVFRHSLGSIEDIFDTKSFVIVGLKPNTTYYYSLSLKETNSVGQSTYYFLNNSKPKSFHTPPAPKIEVATFLENNTTPKTQFTLTNLNGLGANFVKKDKGFNSSLRVEIKGREEQDLHAPSIGKWNGLTSQSFELNPKADSIRFELSNLKEKNYDVLFLAPNPLLIDQQFRGGTKTLVNLASSPYSLVYPKHFNSFGNLVTDLTKPNFYHQIYGNFVKDFGLLNLNGALAQRSSSTRTSLTHLFIPSTYFKNTYFDVEKNKYDTQPISVFTFQPKVQNILPSIKRFGTFANLTFDSKLVPNHLMMSYWESNNPQKRRVIISEQNTLAGYITFEVDNLEPDTDYSFEIYHDNLVLSSGTFRTKTLAQAQAEALAQALEEERREKEALEAFEEEQRRKELEEQLALEEKNKEEEAAQEVTEEEKSQEETQEEAQEETTEEEAQTQEEETSEALEETQQTEAEAEQQETTLEETVENTDTTEVNVSLETEEAATEAGSEAATEEPVVETQDSTDSSDTATVTDGDSTTTQEVSVSAESSTQTSENGDAQVADTTSEGTENSTNSEQNEAVTATTTTEDSQVQQPSESGSGESEDNNNQEGSSAVASSADSSSEEGEEKADEEEQEEEKAVEEEEEEED